MRKTFLLSVFSALILVTAHSQSRSVRDSLRSIYEADTLRGEALMDLLNTLAFYEDQNPELALKYAEELISLAKSAGNTEKLAAGYLQKGNALITNRNLSEALNAYLNSAETFDSIQAKKGQGISYYSLAFTYVESGDIDKAEEWYRKSIIILRDPELINSEDGLTQLASALFNAGELYMRLGDYQKAEVNFREAQQIFEQLNYSTGYYYALGNLGVLHLKTGDLKKAEDNLRSSIDWLNQEGDYAAVTEFQAQMAELYREKKSYTTAHDYAQKSLDNAQRLKLKDQISESSLILAGLDSLIGNYKEAYGHLNLHMRYKDSMDLATVDMTRLEREKAELQVQQQESELQLRAVQQKRQQITLWAVGITALLLTIIAFGSYKRYRFVKNTNQIISEERDRSDSLLQNILPKQTAMELKKLGRVRAQRFDEVTVMFTDFKGFTSHAESLDPEHLVKSIDYYFSHFDTIMDKYSLEKIKTVGDAYMCASGLPYPSEDHAYRILEAALEILEFVETAKKEDSKDHVRFDIRIGINSGPVVAGVVGTKKFAYDIWGDTVNIASRMESASDVGKVNISENTYEIVKNQFDCEYRGIIEVKNRGKLNMYFVLGKKSKSQTA